MHLLSFIGVGDYRQAVYQLDGRTAPATAYPQIALTFLLNDCDGVTVFETEQARKKHRDALESQAHACGVGVNFISIPEGKSEREHWELFAAIEKAACKHDSVALDITHGYRTLPLIGFLTAVFLRVTERVDLSRLLYGAWDARDEETGVTPVFDLTAFLVLADWLTASHVFLKSGNARELSALLQKTHRQLWEQSPGEARELPKSLSSVGKALEGAADSLLLLRRSQRTEAIASLERQIAKARVEIPEFAKPFSAILDAVTDSFTDVGAETEMETERRQIKWLLDRGHADAALTLTREWMVSRTALSFGALEVPGDYESRKDYETFLNVIGGHRHVSVGDLPELWQRAAEEPAWQPVGALWDRLRRVRNDLNHAGYGKDSLIASKLRSKADQLVRETLNLTLPSGENF